MSMPSAPRNPGPGWGYRFLLACDRIVPECLFRPARALGTWVAVAAMPAQRRHSRECLRLVLGREPRALDVFRHFFSFEETLMLKLRVAAGRPHRATLDRDAGDFRRLIDSGRPGLLGTLHVAHSDLAGFLLGGQQRHPIAMIRQRVDNSHDTERLAALFGRWVSFIWVNDRETLLFALKDAVAAGRSVALQCDRLEFSARTEAFRFLGASRVFPFTIYHLALIFDLPVLLSYGTPGAPGESLIHASPEWRPDPAASREENLAAARRHFQAFLQRVETFLRAHPYSWFNFIELNPEAPAA